MAEAVAEAEGAAAAEAKGAETAAAETTSAVEEEEETAAWHGRALVRCTLWRCPGRRSAWCLLLRGCRTSCCDGSGGGGYGTSCAKALVTYPIRPPLAGADSMSSDILKMIYRIVETVYYVFFQEKNAAKTPPHECNVNTMTVCTFTPHALLTACTPTPATPRICTCAHGAGFAGVVRGCSLLPRFFSPECGHFPLVVVTHIDGSLSPQLA